jgi:hypothetical protein
LSYDATGYIDEHKAWIKGLTFEHNKSLPYLFNLNCQRSLLWRSRAEKCIHRVIPEVTTIKSAFNKLQGAQND